MCVCSPYTTFSLYVLIAQLGKGWEGTPKRQKFEFFDSAGPMFLQDGLHVVVPVAISETFDSSEPLGVVWTGSEGRGGKSNEIVG